MQEQLTFCSQFNCWQNP